MQKETLAGRSWVSLPILGEGELSRQREESTFYSFMPVSGLGAQLSPARFSAPTPSAPSKGTDSATLSDTVLIFMEPLLAMRLREELGTRLRSHRKF